MKHTEVALRRPVTTVVVFVALGFIGLLASRLLPLEKFPDIEFPGIYIQIPYEGSTPEEIERLITRPVEEALATLSGVEIMSSESSDDQAQIELQFDWDEDMGAKGIEARAKIDAIRDQLPSDIRRFFIFTGSTSDQPVLQIRISSDRDLSNSYDMLDRLLKRRIERLDGVSRAELQGVDQREIRVFWTSKKSLHTESTSMKCSKVSSKVIFRSVPGELPIPGNDSVCGHKASFDLSTRFAIFPLMMEAFDFAMLRMSGCSHRLEITVGTWIVNMRLDLR